MSKRLPTKSSSQNVQDKSLFVSDIFSSIQGEGKNLGKPSLFLRLGICNLQCTWCDTPYTWKKGQTDYKQQTIESIFKKLLNLKKESNNERVRSLKPRTSLAKQPFLPPHGIQNLVITGGEPLLQQTSLTPLLQEIFRSKEFNQKEFKKTKTSKNITVEFETNGSIPLLPAFKKAFKKQLENGTISFNISPKLKDSGNKPYKLQLYPNSILKFVYVDKNSEKLILDFLKKHQVEIAKNSKQSRGALQKQHPLAKNPPVYIMAEGTTIKEMEKKYSAILKFCMENGFQFTPRWHIYLFGNKRAT
ncbi:MAG: 7-carboxy-7-deazaguanine synthase QueE [Candidatus Gracilibacteria bacterium]|jgi:organic radical activating enzyme